MLPFSWIRFSFPKKQSKRLFWFTCVHVKAAATKVSSRCSSKRPKALKRNQTWDSLLCFGAFSFKTPKFLHRHQWALTIRIKHGSPATLLALVSRHKHLTLNWILQHPNLTRDSKYMPSGAHRLSQIEYRYLIFSLIALCNIYRLKTSLFFFYPPLAAKAGWQSARTH